MNENSLGVMGILLGYLFVGVLFATQTPAWQAPDEPAHYNYVRQVAENGCCPVIALGDWESPYLDTLTSNRFAPELLNRLESIQYEDHQPPLYYLLLSPVYQITYGSLTALRIASVIIGSMIVVAAYNIGRLLLPNRAEIALGAAAFVALLPQHAAILASVNNDALGLALVSLILWATLAYLRSVGTPFMVYALGVLMGIAFLTKATTYLMAGVVVLAIVAKALTPPPSPLPINNGEGESNAPRQTRRGVGVRLSHDLTAFLTPAFLLGALWWLRNFSVYGFPDFLGLRAHDVVVVGQLRTADYIAQLGGFSAYLGEMLRTTFQSFWGQFGWMALPLPTWMYWAIGGLLVMAITGLVMARLTPPLRAAGSPPRPVYATGEQPSSLVTRHSSLVLTALVSLSLLQFLYYNTQFVQFQGRYLYPLLIPFALMVVYGVDTWRRLILGRVGWSRWLTLLLMGGFALVDVWLLFRVIIPNLSPLQ